MFVVIRRNDYSKEIVKKRLRYGGFEDEFKFYDDIYLRGWDYDCLLYTSPSPRD